MGLLKLIWKIIFFPFYFLRGMFASRQYRLYLKQRASFDRELDKLHRLKRKVKRDKNANPAALNEIGKRENYIRLARHELRKTYVKQKRLSRHPTSMWAFQSEKRSEKRLRQTMGRLK